MDICQIIRDEFSDTIKELLDDDDNENGFYIYHKNGKYSRGNIIRGNRGSILLDDDEEHYVGDFHTHPIPIKEAIYNTIFSSDDLHMALMKEPKFKCIGYKSKGKKRLKCIDTSDIDKIADFKHDVTRAFEKKLVEYVRAIIDRYNINTRDFNSLEELIVFLKNHRKYDYDMLMKFIRNEVSNVRKKERDILNACSITI